MRLIVCIGSGKRLQDAVRIPVDRTISLLAQHLGAQSAPDTTRSTVQNPQQHHRLPVRQPAPDSYNQSNGYNSYTTSINNTGTHEQPSHSYLPNNDDVPGRVSEAYPDPQYAYQTPYGSGDPTYVSPPYTSNETLPATAAAANAYLSHYPHQQSHLNPSYPSHINNNNYGQYHSPGSPTSWRNWAGNMASNLEPGAEYMSSASALMQLGGRSEGPVSHDFAVDSSTGQAWPLMLFDNGTGGGQ